MWNFWDRQVVSKRCFLKFTVWDNSWFTASELPVSSLHCSVSESKISILEWTHTHRHTHWKVQRQGPLGANSNHPDSSLLSSSRLALFPFPSHYSSHPSLPLPPSHCRPVDPIYHLLSTFIYLSSSLLLGSSSPVSSLCFQLISPVFVPPKPNHCWASHIRKHTLPLNALNASALSYSWFVPIHHFNSFSKSASSYSAGPHPVKMLSANIEMTCSMRLP